MRHVSRNHWRNPILPALFFAGVFLLFGCEDMSSIPVAPDDAMVAEGVAAKGNPHSGKTASVSYTNDPSATGALIATGEFSKDRDNPRALELSSNPVSVQFNFSETKDRAQNGGCLFSCDETIQECDTQGERDALIVELSNALVTTTTAAHDILIDKDAAEVGEASSDNRLRWPRETAGDDYFRGWGRQNPPDNNIMVVELVGGSIDGPIREFKISGGWFRVLKRLGNGIASLKCPVDDSAYLIVQE